jgi:formate dehydrogenase maturation protein FdhE
MYRKKVFVAAVLDTAADQLTVAGLAINPEHTMTWQTMLNLVRGIQREKEAVEKEVMKYCPVCGLRFIAPRVCESHGYIYEDPGPGRKA